MARKSNKNTSATSENTTVEGTVETAKTRKGAIGFRLFSVTDGGVYTAITDSQFASQPDAMRWLKLNPQPHGQTIQIHRISRVLAATAPQRVVSDTVYRVQG